MPLIVDSDTHIAESQGMWRAFPENLVPRRPVLVDRPDRHALRHEKCLLADRRQHLSEAGRQGRFQPDHAVRVRVPALARRHRHRLPRGHRRSRSSGRHGPPGCGRAGRLSDALPRLPHRRRRSGHCPLRRLQRVDGRGLGPERQPHPLDSRAAAAFARSVDRAAPCGARAGRGRRIHPRRRARPHPRRPLLLPALRGGASPRRADLHPHRRRLPGRSPPSST